MSLVEVKDACFAYDRKTIFENIRLKVDKGEILCIVGPNGCGKTTLLDCVLGVKKLKSGSILINGRNINTIRVSDVAKQAAYVPQAHERTFPYTVKEIVLMGRAAYTGLFSSPSGEDRDIAEECLRLVGIDEFEDRPYTQLSGGEGQLVMLARALAQKTPVIVMDEPTAHLDFKNELTVLETIVKMVKEAGLAVIMATHFPNHAFYFENNNLTTHVALMNDRKISRIGFPNEVLSEENLEELYRINARIVSCRMESGRELKQIIPVCTKV